MMMNSQLVISEFRRYKSRLSYYHRPGEQPLLNLTIGELLEEASKKWGNREALVSVHQKKRLTFKELRDQATLVAAGLINCGIEPGKCLGIFAPNLYEWQLVQLAAAKAGYILVNINPAYEAPELRHSLKLGKVSALVLADKFKSRDLQDVLLKAVPDIKFKGNGQVESKELPNLNKIITIGKNVPKNNMNFEDLIFKDLKLAEDIVNPIEDKVEIHDAYNIQFTSGTTGFPKAALLTHHGTVNNSFIVGKRMGYHEKEHRICMPTPYFHCFGCVLGVLCSLNHGATIVLPADAHSTPLNIAAIQSENCNVCYGTPTMHVDLMNEAKSLGLNAPKLGLEKLITGGALCPEQLFKKLILDFGIKDICLAYGMTECSPINFLTLRNDDLHLQSTTVGRVAEHWEAKVVDEEGRMVPFGKPGELWVRGYGTMLGYWDDPKATAEMIRHDGWLKTGDQLTLDEEGYGRIVGRLKDMIIRGGENIFPREIEDVLHEHPDVLEAHVYGAPDERLGEIVCANIRLRTEKNTTVDEIKNFCKGKMATFKIPHHIELTQDFPKTTSGKIQKYKLREAMIEKSNQLSTT